MPLQKKASYGRREGPHLRRLREPLPLVRPSRHSEREFLNWQLGAPAPVQWQLPSGSGGAYPLHFNYSTDTLRNQHSLQKKKHARSQRNLAPSQIRPSSKTVSFIFRTSWMSVPLGVSTTMLFTRFSTRACLPQNPHISGMTPSPRQRPVASRVAAISCSDLISTSSPGCKFNDIKSALDFGMAGPVVLDDRPNKEAKCETTLLRVGTMPRCLRRQQKAWILTTSKAAGRDATAMSAR